VTDVTNIIDQLEQQKASINRAIEALREITDAAVPPMPRASVSSPSSDGKSQRSHITAEGKRKLAAAMKRRWAVKRAAAGKSSTASPMKGRALSAKQKRAISQAWTPERKQKFAEFHVQRMARERGDDPAKALREYRRRKQKEQTGNSPTSKTSRTTAPRKAAPHKPAAGRKTTVKKTVAKTAVAATA